MHVHNDSVVAINAGRIRLNDGQEVFAGFGGFQPVVGESVDVRIDTFDSGRKQDCGRELFLATGTELLTW